MFDGGIQRGGSSAVCESLDYDPRGGGGYICEGEEYQSEPIRYVYFFEALSEDFIENIKLVLFTTVLGAAFGVYYYKSNRDVNS